MNIVDVIKSETEKLQKEIAVIDGNKQILISIRCANFAIRD